MEDTDAKMPPSEEAAGTGAKSKNTDDDDGFTSRPYQEQIIDLAMKRNTIIFLPTGAGKTYIALQTIKRLSKVLEKPFAEGGKRSVFLTNTVVLAKQQAYWIARLTPLRTICYTGDMDVDNWSGERWRTEFDSNQVVVATCQIVLDVLRHGYVAMHELNIIVMDECHNATGKHQMSQLMTIYHDGCARGVLSAANRPRIMGLSGALLGNQVRSITVVQDLERMERQFDATITTVSSTDDFVNVLVYSSNPLERYVTFQASASGDTHIKRSITAQVERFLSKVVDKWPLEGTKLVTTKTQFRSGQVKLTKTVRKLFSDFQYQMNDLGMYGAALSILALLVELEIEKRRADANIKKQLCRAAITFAERIRHQLIKLWQEPEPMTTNAVADNESESAKAIVDPKKKANCKDSGDEIGHVAIEASPVDSMETILSESSPKVLALLHFLSEHCRSVESSNDLGVGLKCLVFVQRRHTAKLLYHVLKNYAAAVAVVSATNPKSVHRFPIRPDFIVGNNSALSESIESVLENKYNGAVLDRFKRNETNVIVATSVLEEGVDLQMCNLVINFDTPSTYRSYIQSKGRARMRNSTYAIMVTTSEELKLRANVEEFKLIETQLRRYLIGRSIDRPIMSQRSPLMTQQTTDAEPPLRTSAGAILHTVAALALVNRYNMTLPTDEFCQRMKVRWSVLSELPPMVQMRLPMQSPLKGTFESCPGATHDFFEAKRSAALRACRALYDYGELDSHLMPYSRRRVERTVEEELCSHWQRGRFAGDAQRMRRNQSTSGCRTTDDGTGLSRQHAIECPAPLCGGMPRPGCVANLYCISIEPIAGPAATVPDPKAGDRSEFQRRFGDTTHGFGVLTMQELPECGVFTLNSLAGPVQITFAGRPVPVQLASCSGHGNEEGDELVQLRRFHEFVFRDVLNIVSTFLVADHDNKEHAYLIVPTTTAATATAIGSNVSINWSLVQRFQEPIEMSGSNIGGDDPLTHMAARKRAKLQFRAEDYLDRVVYPWYRMDSDRRYIVVRVHEHLTPFSPFPNEAFDSYAAYIEDKYQLQVANAEQFMLEVLCINDSSGLNALAPQEHKQFSGRHVEMLIPELCENLAFPGDLWLKAMLLPSVLHRLHMQLNAEWLRKQLNAQLTIPLSTGYKPWPIVEQRNRNAATHKYPEDIIPVRAIVIPNPEETPIREIRRDEFVSVSSMVDKPWNAPVEPLDVGRNLLDLFPLELDYLYNFINDRMGGLHLSDNSSNVYHMHSEFNASSGLLIRGALCTTSGAVESEIRLLRLDKATETRGFDQTGLLVALISPAAKDIVDYRRRAILGKVVIAFAVTLHLVSKRPIRHVGWLRCAFDRLTGGHNLAVRGIEHGLAGRIKCTVFAPRDDWTPPLQCVPRAIQSSIRQVNAAPHCLFRLQLSAEEKRTGCVQPSTIYTFIESFLQDDCHVLVVDADTTPSEIDDGEDCDDPSTGGQFGDSSMGAFVGVQRVADADVANVLRAVIGESAVQLGLRQTFNVLRYFEVLPESSAAVDLLNGVQLRTARNDTVANNDAAINELLVNCSQLEETLCYTFRDRGYLLQALSHPSFEANLYTDCNQTLAILGAAICELLITAYCAEHADHLVADELRDLCSALSSNIARACFCVRHKIHLHMLFAGQALGEKISAFQAFQEREKYRLNDRVLLLIEETDARMGEYVDVPSAVGDCFAAVLAALYLDCGRDLQLVWQCLWRLVGDDAERLMWQVPKDVVQRLVEWPGAKPRFEKALADDDVLMVAVRFTRRDEVVLVHGFGQTAGKAKLAAAKVALHVLMQ